MIVYPAVDIRRGRCVQLTQGAPETEVVYDEDPAAQAQRWVGEGASALHVVNLDGTLAYPEGGITRDGEPLPLSLRQVAAIRKTVAVPIQFAGGLRAEADLELAMELGVDRVVIGTAAVLRPELVSWALARWGSDRIVVAIEVRDGVVVTHGWQRATPLDPVRLGRRMYALGARTALLTDVAREGLLGGVDPMSAVRLAEDTGLSTIVSGGVGGLDDIRRLASAGDAVAGVVIGQALYTGRLGLRAAIAAAAAAAASATSESS